jgi:membrane protease YdiL (CAAX protease family)
MPGARRPPWGLSIWTYTLYVPALSVILAWVYHSTGGSVLLCAILHGSLDAAAVTGYPFGGLTSQMVLVLVTWTAAGGVALASSFRDRRRQRTDADAIAVRASLPRGR